MQILNLIFSTYDGFSRTQSILSQGASVLLLSFFFSSYKCRKKVSEFTRELSNESDRKSNSTNGGKIKD